MDIENIIHQIKKIGGNEQLTVSQVEKVKEAIDKCYTEDDPDSRLIDKGENEEGLYRLIEFSFDDIIEMWKLSTKEKDGIVELRIFLYRKGAFVLSHTKHLQSIEEAWKDGYKIAKSLFAIG